MSILSELGKFFGEKHAELDKKIEEDKVRIETLEQEISLLKGKLESVSPSFNDIKMINPDRGLILMSEDHHLYRIRITSEKKIVIDDLTNGKTMQENLYPFLLVQVVIL